MLYQVNTQRDTDGLYRSRVTNDSKQIVYFSEGYTSKEDAEKEVFEWDNWAENVTKGRADTIYYIVAVPHDWTGSPIMEEHPYMGLRIKIGYSKHPQKRVKELQTGTMDQLILHALEPGDRSVEKKRHAQFADHRRIGEWFICSKALANHVINIWGKYRILPPLHQQNIMVLIERIKLYRAMRGVFEGSPDLVNPPLDVAWKGKIFLDLTDMEE